MNRDTSAFALLLGVPIFSVSCALTILVRYIAGETTAWMLGGALAVGWPVYYIVVTFKDRQFVEGLPLLLYTVPAMVAGWLIPLVLLR